MQRLFPAIVAAVALLWMTPITGTGSGAQGVAPQRPAGPPAFTVRVNPKWAADINEVLGELGEWIEITVPAGTAASGYLKQFCGGRTPAHFESTQSDTGTKIRFSPCARLKRDVEIRMTAGDTLEGVAARSGLARTDATKLKVKSAIQSEQSEPVDPTKLRAGDVVVVPELPLWTQVTAKAEKVADRAAFIAAIALKLKCASRTSAEDCLLRHGVTVLDRGTVLKPPPSLPPPPPPLSTASALLGETGAALVSVTEDSAAAAVPPVPVAKGQWPYDERLVEAILIDPSVRVNRVVIGVADGGLADGAGSPLPRDLFAIGADQPDDNNVDDDGNDYVDDAIGAGLPRPGEPFGSGNVGLCGKPLDFMSWGPDPISVFSHGTVIASIASGLKMRAVPGVAPRLPQIVFFRMLQHACTPDADYSVGDGEMVTAFDYLTTRSSIINISYTIDSSRVKAFTNTMKATLPYFNRLLVLPAGNDTPGDLDVSPICPACLGNDSLDDKVARRTLVVGAATRELKRAAFSNFGEHTVRLFAPAEPLGAINVKGNAVTASDTTTSYAAPLAALAAGLMESLGITDPDDVRDRLMVATWPLEDPVSRPERTNVGVLDLVKATAVQHDAVEVIERDENGSPVRRTYVGKLLDPLPKVAVCAGQPFQTNAVQAVRLGTASASGDRPVRLYWRNKKGQNNRRLIQTISCRPTGSVRIDALTVGERTFPLSSVTQIQLHWIP